MKKPRRTSVAAKREAVLLWTQSSSAKSLTLSWARSGWKARSICKARSTAWILFSLSIVQPLHIMQSTAALSKRKSGRGAAVDDEHLARHERRLIGSQVQGCVADLLGLADAADRLRCLDVGAVLGVLPEIGAEIGLHQ